MNQRRGWKLGAALMAITITAAACGGDDSDTSAAVGVTETTAPAEPAESETTPEAPEETAAAEVTDTPDDSAAASETTAASGDPSGDPFGAPNPAAGDPILFGMLSQEAGPVTFPDVRAGAQAAAQYVNEYRGGINGRPIEISVCVTDGQPSSSERCANQILDENPVAIIGAIDTGASASMPVWERADLPFLGGLPLTPAENLSPQAVQFYQAAIGDNAAGAVYAATDLGAESVVVLYTDDPTGQSLALETIIPTFESVFDATGVEGSVQSIAVPPAAADLAAPAAAAVAENPDVIFVVVPNACANMHLALQAVGNEAQIFTIGPCFQPSVLEAGGSSMIGVMHASPFLERSPGTEEGALFFASLDRWADEGTPPSPLTLGGFGTVINIQAMLDGVEDLSSESILTTFRTGSDHPNFMAHPYTCDGEQLGVYVAACNPWQRIYQVEDDLEEYPISDWFSPGEFLG